MTFSFRRWLAGLLVVIPFTNSGLYLLPAANVVRLGLYVVIPFTNSGLYLPDMSKARRERRAVAVVIPFTNSGLYLHSKNLYSKSLLI